MEAEKAFSDVKRTRYNPEHRFKSILGHTARRRRDAYKPSPSVSRDKQWHGPNAWSTERLVTEFELEGFEAGASLDRDSRWESVPRLLGIYAPPNQTERLEDGVVKMRATLPVVEVCLPDPSLAAEKREYDSVLYSVTGDTATHTKHGKKRSWRFRPRGLKHFADLPTAPPDVVPAMCRLLPARLRCAGYDMRSPAIVRANAPYAAFDVECARGRPLDIDLGVTCRVGAFSTQGRHPFTRRYPYVAFDQKDGWCVEGQPDWDPLMRYKGPYYQVVETSTSTLALAAVTPRSHRRNWASAPARWTEPQYVTRYELLWRADHGRVWNSLGVFKGNEDATSEVAHATSAAAGRSGLVCRYLRVVPLDCVGGGALRVGVYGESLRHATTPYDAAAEGNHAATASGADGDERAQLCDEEGEPLGVTYTIETAGEAFNPKYCAGKRAAAGCSRCRCSWCKPDVPRSSARLRARLDAANEARSTTTSSSTHIYGKP